LVTDEEILFRSLPATVKVSREALFQPYYVEKNGKRLNIIFRDRNLSDLIGFAYQKWQSKDAVGDFLAKLKEVKQAFADKKEGPTLLTIALDGENCWEYYPNDGRDFLSSLYEKLSEERNFSCVTVSEFLEQFPAQEKLEHIFAGSWIYANFTTWIGQSEKNLAWDYLSKARKKLAESAAARPQFVKDATWKKAWEKIYIAEGSDWFWWYGRNLPDSAIGKFDELFRKNLSQVYQLLAEPVPDYLKLPIRTEPKETVIVPTSLIKPTINGIEDNYLEWLGAGELDLCGSADCVIQRFFWGFAQENLYLRFDLNFDYREKDFKKDIILNIFFSQPELKIRIALDKLSAFIFLKTETDSWQRKKQIFTIAWKKILELEIARDEFFTDKGKTEIWAVLEKEGQVLEACPKTGRISLNFPDKDFEASSWSV
jgi:alpha-amylase/alpha-mannosidase (GH57 family)